MSQEVNAVLQRSLDAVDRHQKRLMWAVAAALVLVLFSFYHLHHGRMNDVGDAIGASLVILCFWTAGLAFTVVLQITVATKRILRAIDLASRPRD